MTSSGVCLQSSDNLGNICFSGNVNMRSPLVTLPSLHAAVRLCYLLQLVSVCPDVQCLRVNWLGHGTVKREGANRAHLPQYALAIKRDYDDFLSLLRVCLSSRLSLRVCLFGYLTLFTRFTSVIFT